MRHRLTQIIFRRSTSLEWYTANTILDELEIARETDTDKFKIGDGKTEWNYLPYSTTLPEKIYMYAGCKAPSKQEYIDLVQNFNI
jgi:hyaluronoglucosaminidase